MFVETEAPVMTRVWLDSAVTDCNPFVLQKKQIPDLFSKRDSNLFASRPLLNPQEKKNLASLIGACV
jgi:hypothetical protein